MRRPRTATAADERRAEFAPRSGVLRVGFGRYLEDVAFAEGASEVAGRVWLLACRADLLRQVRSGPPVADVRVHTEGRRCSVREVGSRSRGEGHGGAVDRVG